MMYLTFHLVFIVPVIVLLLLAQRRPWGSVGGWRGRYSILLVCLIAFVYTTPWDNYLVYREVWGYGADRVLATIGYVPLEEYLFFLLQPLLTGLFVYLILQKKPLHTIRASRSARFMGTSIWASFSLLGVALLATGVDSVLYMGLILAWACPVIAAMWWYAGNAYTSAWNAYLIMIAAPTFYLVITDLIAINLGIWHISEVYTIGIELLDMPVEEALFFFLTNVLVVQGVLLFLFGDKIAESHPPESGPGRLARKLPI